MVATYNFELDWILRPAIEAGMEIVKIGVFSYSQDVIRNSFAIELNRHIQPSPFSYGIIIYIKIRLI